MNGLRIEEAGPGHSIQDHGRFGWRRFGISTAGAMDRLHLAIANRLVGNPPEAAAIETMLSGCRLGVVGGPALIAVAGAGLSLSIDGRLVPVGQSVEAAAGQTVVLSPVRTGVYGYLAVAGGFAQNPTMGSLSRHRRSGLGPPPLQAGMTLPIHPSPTVPAPLRLAQVPGHATGPIRFLWGPQEDWFVQEARTSLTSAHWVIGQRSDRMGLFLNGPALTVLLGSMVSDGVVPGSIQVPPSGSPVILMRDCQTTGGYPKIATVISADLDRLAQMRPGDEVRLEAVSHDTALMALSRARAAVVDLRTEPALRQPDTAWLLQHNLIGGVWPPSVAK